MSAFARQISAGAAVTQPGPRRRLAMLSHSPSTVRFFNSPTSLLSQRPRLVTRGTHPHRQIELRSVRCSTIPTSLRCNCAAEDVDRSAAGRECDAVSEVAAMTVERENDAAVKVAVAAALTVVLGVGNRVLYKLALVPLKQYPFFLAQFATFGSATLSQVFGLFKPILANIDIVKCSRSKNSRA